MPDRKTFDEKLLGKIERAMKKYSMNNVNVPKLIVSNGTDTSGFIFPNGAVYFIEEDHFIIAKNILKSLRVDVDDVHPLDRFLSLDVLRFALIRYITKFGDTQRTFIVNSGTINNTVENTILDVASGHIYNEVTVHLENQKREEYLKRKLEKGMTE